MTLAAAARIVNGHVPPAHGDVAFSRVTTDSRTICERDLFVALKGDAFEGHDFVTAALDAGASAAMVHQPRDTFVDRPCIAVRDTKLALGQLARTWRARFTLPLIGVAGSNGKTTVTQMIASILRAFQGKAAFHTEGNLNNDIGLPLTVLRLDDTHRIGVVELGMNHPGEIAYLSGIARPTIGVVTNAQREHQEFMKTVRDAAIENASMFDFLPADGMAIVNADDAHHSLFVDRAGGRAVMSFGMEQPADVRAIVDQGDAMFGSHLSIVTPSGTVNVALAIAGRHNALNAAAATAACVAAGVSLSHIAQGLQAFRPVEGRLVKSLLPSGAVLLDDTYNANPDSVRAAIDVLASIGGRRVLVLGPMAEVGDQGPAFHREIGDYARSRGIDRLLAIGDATAPATDAFGSGASRHGDINALIDATNDEVAAGTTLLVKGSRSARMERVIDALTDTRSGGGH